MKLVESVQSFLAMLGMRSNQSLANVYFFIAELIICTNIASNWLFLICEASTFREYTNAIFLTSTISMAGVCFTLFAAERQRIFNMISFAEELVEKRSTNPTKRAMYEYNNRMANKWTRIAFTFLTTVTPVSFIYPKALICYFFYFTSDLGNDAFDLPYAIWFPFDWKNPFGYAVAVFIQYMMTVNLFMIGASMLCGGIGGVLLVNAIIHDLKSYLTEIDENAVVEENYEEATEQLCDFVEIHAHMIQIFADIFEVLERLGMIYFTWSMVVVCGAMLLVQNEISKPDIDYIALLAMVAEACYASFSVCVACELGQRVTNVFFSITDVVEQFHWYLYPEAMWRMLMIILPIVQKPVDINCFGSFAANRLTCKKIVNAGFSYFTVLRNFTH